MPNSLEADGLAGKYPTSFGRGWIPADRDIGLPQTARLADDSPPADLSPEKGTAAPSAFAANSSPIPNHNTWTPARKAAFLHHLAETGNVRASAARVGLSHQSGYLARRRDRVFKAGWDAALVLAREVAAQALATRALDGTPEAVWFKGQQVGTKVRYDSRLLLAHLARLDKAAEETDAGDLAERFDELLAQVAGEAPAEAMADLGTWDSPAPLVPVARETFAYRAAPRLQEEAREQWRADLRARKATRADEPTDLLTPWFEQALAEWDAWHARACAAVDAAVAGESLPVPKVVMPQVEIDMASFYAPDDDEDEDAILAGERRYEEAYTQDDIVTEYKSMELGLKVGQGLGMEGSRRPGLDPGPVSLSPDLAWCGEGGGGLREGGAVAEPDPGQARVDGETAVDGDTAVGVSSAVTAGAVGRTRDHPHAPFMSSEAETPRTAPACFDTARHERRGWGTQSALDTGNCGNLSSGQPVWTAPNLRATRQPSALARLLAGQRPGGWGESPQRRSSPL